MPKWPNPEDIEAVMREAGNGDDWSRGPGMDRQQWLSKSCNKRAMIPLTFILFSAFI